jgi:predicted DNA-binding transcriptional regulator YafY
MSPPRPTPLATRGRPRGRFTQHRRIDRLRELFARHPNGLTLYELASLLHVTTRTMRRYLGELGREYELESVETRHGGSLRWRIRASELPRKVELRRTQAYALLAARRIFEPLRGSALFDEIDMAIDKLTSCARRPGRGPNAGLADARLEDRFLYLPHAPKDYAEKTAELDDLFQAVSDLKPLDCRYRSLGRASEEKITVHPYALVLHRDSIYCVGYHVERGAVRTLLLDRMRDTETRPTERFTLPADFDIERYFQGDFGVWHGATQHRVVIDFDARAAEYVRLRKAHPTQKLSATAAGGVRLTMQVGDLTQLVSWVLEWGARARVVEPPELVERVREELGEALSHYATLPKPEATKPSRSSVQRPSNKPRAP